MPRKDPAARNEEERQRFKRDLEAVGENLPDDVVDTEGSDVGTIERDRPDEERFARELAAPHEDAETDLVKELDLTDD